VTPKQRQKVRVAKMLPVATVLLFVIPLISTLNFPFTPAQLRRYITPNKISNWPSGFKTCFAVAGVLADRARFATLQGLCKELAHFGAPGADRQILSMRQKV
jgi:hypothetical protein